MQFNKNLHFFTLKFAYIKKMLYLCTKFMKEVLEILFNAIILTLQICFYLTGIFFFWNNRK